MRYRMGSLDTSTFYANVSIQRRCDQRANHSKDVAGSLEAVLRNTKVAGIDDILTLVSVHEKAVEHIDEVDKKLRKPHPLGRNISQCRFEDEQATYLEEISRMLHLRHEFWEDHRASV